MIVFKVTISVVIALIAQVVVHLTTILSRPRRPRFVMEEKTTKTLQATYTT